MVPLFVFFHASKPQRIMEHIRAARLRVGLRRSPHAGGQFSLRAASTSPQLALRCNPGQIFSVPLYDLHTASSVVLVDALVAKPSNHGTSAS
jgi:hypothetical protein